MAGSSTNTPASTARRSQAGSPLALDTYEHAYHIDFGANAPLTSTFLRNVDWQAVEGRLMTQARWRRGPWQTNFATPASASRR
jgi:superoxide dismutase